MNDQIYSKIGKRRAFATSILSRAFFMGLMEVDHIILLSGTEQNVIYKLNKDKSISGRPVIGSRIYIP